MENKKRNIYFALILVALTVLFLVHKKNELNSSDLTTDISNDTAIHSVVNNLTDNHNSENDNRSKSAANSVMSNSTAAMTLKSTPPSLKKMTDILYQYARPEVSISYLYEHLKATEQKPFIVNDTNPVTGTMTLVRTQNPMPGTRYFHAQYFGEDDNDKYVQHMSFEFKPGPDAMEQAIATVKSTFGHLGEPTKVSADFIEWELRDGYVLWIKKLDKSDIEDNPFNAYTDEDIGSLRIAIEQSPEANHKHGI